MITLQDITPGNIFKNGDSLFVVTPSNIDYAIQQVQNSKVCQLEGVELSEDVLRTVGFEMKNANSLSVLVFTGSCGLSVSIHEQYSSVFVNSERFDEVNTIHKLQLLHLLNSGENLPINLPALEKALGMKVKNDIERNYRFGFDSTKPKSSIEFESDCLIELNTTTDLWEFKYKGEVKCESKSKFQCRIAQQKLKYELKV